MSRFPKEELFENAVEVNESITNISNVDVPNPVCIKTEVMIKNEPSEFDGLYRSFCQNNKNVPTDDKELIPR